MEDKVDHLRAGTKSKLALKACQDKRANLEPREEIRFLAERLHSSAGYSSRCGLAYRRQTPAAFSPAVDGDWNRSREMG